MDKKELDALNERINNLPEIAQSYILAVVFGDLRHYSKSEECAIQILRTIEESADRIEEGV